MRVAVTCVPTCQPAPLVGTQMRMLNFYIRAGWSHASTTRSICFVDVALAQLSMSADPEASIALPFTPRPAMLTGELVGDVGFDPLNFSEEVSSEETICGAGWVPV